MDGLSKQKLFNIIHKIQVSELLLLGKPPRCSSCRKMVILPSCKKLLPITNFSTHALWKGSASVINITMGCHKVVLKHNIKSLCLKWLVANIWESSSYWNVDHSLLIKLKGVWPPSMVQTQANMACLWHNLWPPIFSFKLLVTVFIYNINENLSCTDNPQIIDVTRTGRISCYMS